MRWLPIRITRRRRLGRDASVFYRAEHAEEYWPAWRERNPSAAAPAPPLVTREARSAAASVSLRGWLTEDYQSLAALERRGALPPDLAKAEAGRKLLSDTRFRKRYIGRGEPSDEKYKI